MNRDVRIRRVLLAWALVLVTCTTGVAIAQTLTGNVYGTVTDTKGEALPGVSVTLSGVGAPVVQTTDERGAFRFLGLSPGTYRVEAGLEGYSNVVYEEVVVNVNRNTTLEVKLSPAVQETITVTAESPLLDQRKITAGATVSAVELEKIPTARDPWVVLQQTPGVTMDRVNIGGSESGQQSNYLNPGTSSDNSQWAVDGVVITDMGAIGASPTYYDFDAFEEMQVTTGGSDASLTTGGVTLNMVTKRGTNEWRASGRYFVTPSSEDVDFDSSVFGRPGSWNRNSTQSAFAQGNKVEEVIDYGAEVGGPIVKDRLWIWGSYGKNDIDLLTASGVQGSTAAGSHDKTQLENYAGKLNWQIVPQNSATGFYYYGNKTKQGRDARPQRPPETTYNQDGPSEIFKVEDSHIFSSSFFLTLMASKVDSWFSLTPQGGGIGVNDPNFNVTRTSDLVWHNSYFYYITDRPQDQFKGDGSAFFNTGNLSHELKFGVGYRKAPVDSYSVAAGQQLVGKEFEPGFGYVYAYLPYQSSDEGKYTSAYLQDTLSVGSLTANVGLRYDLQKGKNLPASIPAHPIYPALLPAASFDGGDPGFEWETITPRLGLTYAVGEEKQTLLRLSYSQFADQLGTGTIARTNPTAAYLYGYFYWYNDHDPTKLSLDEVGPLVAVNYTVPLDILNVNDPDVNAPLTNELLFGVEHALRPEFVLNFTGTYRIYTDILEFDTLVNKPGCTEPRGCAVTRADYTQWDADGNSANGITNLNVVRPDGTSISVPVYRLAPGITRTGGSYMRNGGRETEYLGLTVGFNKRLSNKWMARGNVTWADWTWNVPSDEPRNPNRLWPGGDQDGDTYVECPAGSGKGNVCMSAQWSADLSGMYQVAPDKVWGFNLAGNINARQGYAIPYFVATRPTNTGTQNILAASDPAEFENDTVLVINARVEKEFKFDRFSLTASIDGFNLLDDNTVLRRNWQITATNGGTTSSTGDFVQEFLAGRALRFGLRFSFNS